MSKTTEQQRKNIAKWALYGLLIFFAFTVADLAIIYYRDHFLPDQAPPKKSPKIQSSFRIDRGQYNIITNRNLFSSTGQIPDPLRPKEEDVKKNDVPVQSNLPITLLGTLVHSNPEKSVAAVEITSKKITGSYMVGSEIEGLARVESIQRGIIYFRNLNNQALEYIEMNQGNNKVSFDQNKPAVTVPVSTGKEIQKVGDNTFKIRRSDLNKYLNDLSSLLMQARAVPNKDPNTGEVNGYRLVDYQPGSIFEQLGLPRNTLIKKAGGEPVTNVQAAMEMFNKMKNENNVQLEVEVNGSTQTYKYEIQ